MLNSKTEETEISLRDHNLLFDLEPGWWRKESNELLHSVLFQITSARSKTTTERNDDLGRALQMMSTAAFDHFKTNAQGIDPRRTEQSHESILTPLPMLDDMTDLLDRLFEQPSQRLAVYGTLRPGESNAGQLSGIEGEWFQGSVPGFVTQPGDYLEFTWNDQAAPVVVMVFSSQKLSEHFNRLDEFEGPEYRRSLVPVVINGVVQICNIYEGRAKYDA